MKLAIELKPYFNETLTSWIIRNSIANGTDPKSFALSVFKTHSTWYKDIDRQISEEQLYLLCSVTSLTKQQIINLTLTSLVNTVVSKDLANPFKWGFIIPFGLKGSVRTSGFSFCPECLDEGNYCLKKEWKLAWCVSCTKHKKLLVTNCPNCNQPFSPHLIEYTSDKIYQCTNCTHDLRTIKTKQVNGEVLELQEELSSIAFNSKYNNDFPLLINSDIKDLFLTIEKLISFCRYAYLHEKYNTFFQEIAIEKLHTFQEGNNKSFSRLNTEDREFILLVINKVLKLKLDDIISLLQKIEISKTTFLKTTIHTSKTIQYIASNLKDTRMNKPARKVFKKIEPKNKYEVNDLFNDIEKHIPEALLNTEYSLPKKQYMKIQSSLKKGTSYYNFITHYKKYLNMQVEMSIVSVEHEKKIFSLTINFLIYCQNFKDTKLSVEMLHGYIWIYPKHRYIINKFIEFLSNNYSISLCMSNIPLIKLQRPKRSHEILKSRLIKLLQNNNSKLIKESQYFRIVIGYLHWIDIPTNIYINISNIKFNKVKNNYYINLNSYKFYIPIELVNFLIK
ncbi:MAG: hypothetical protein DRG78_06200 [Epsilonproteobacteria bacterium]|nr:MAG: hypothetical protein DRG78_06200 [Campylobacterota bacterium]